MNRISMLCVLLSLALSLCGCRLERAHNDWPGRGERAVAAPVDTQPVNGAQPAGPTATASQAEDEAADQAPEVADEGAPEEGEDAEASAEAADEGAAEEAEGAPGAEPVVPEERKPVPPPEYHPTATLELLHRALEQADSAVENGAVEDAIAALESARQLLVTLEAHDPAGIIEHGMASAMALTSAQLPEQALESVRRTQYELDGMGVSDEIAAALQELVDAMTADEVDNADIADRMESLLMAAREGATGARLFSDIQGRLQSAIQELRLGKLPVAAAELASAAAPLQELETVLTPPDDELAEEEAAENETGEETAPAEEAETATETGEAAAPSEVENASSNKPKDAG